MTQPSLQIRLVDVTADSAQASAALELVVEGVPASEQKAQLALLQGELSGSGSHAILIISARRGDRLVGAAFAQILPGKTAGVWPPQIVAEEEETTAGKLLVALEQQLRQRGVRLAQSLLAPDAAACAEQLMSAGYRHAAELLYLVSEAQQYPDDAPRLPFRLEPFQPTESERLARLVEATYAGTLDCPLLDNLRDTADVLAGYRAVGEFRPELWHIARCDGRDIGCLLLADHPQQAHWELIYMGLTPEVRGRSWGIELARQAQWLARQAERERLVLAVDAANHPAIRVYTACGFRACDHRSVFVKNLSPLAEA